MWTRIWSVFLLIVDFYTTYNQSKYCINISSYFSSYFFTVFFFVSNSSSRTVDGAIRQSYHNNKQITALIQPANFKHFALR